MARRNATSAPVAVASKQNQDEEEVAEDGDWEQFVYAERLVADSVATEDQGEFSLLLREQLDAEQEDPEEEDEDEDVSDNVLNVLNNATSTPRTSSRALQDDEPQQDPPFSIRKRVTGLFTEGLRLLGSSGSRPNDNDITDDTSPAEARDDNMQLRSTSASASKAPNKLSRPSVLHQPLNTYKPSPQGSGKPDVYDLHASPEKAATTPTRTQSKQAQGVKRKRNNTAAAKKPPPKEQIKAEAPTRVTRSRGSGEIVEPIDYSRKVEDTGKRKRSGGTVGVEPPPRASRKRNKKVIEDEVDESEDGDRPSTPGNQNLAEEDIPAEEAASPPTLQKPHAVDELPEATPSVSDKGSQSSAASGPSDATAKSIKKGKNATVEDKEDPDDQDFEDSGSGVEYSGSEGELEPESEEEAESKTEEELKPKTEGISPINAAIPRRKRQGELQISIKSPYFGNDFIAASNIIKVTELVDKLGMNQPKDTQNDTEPLRKADTFDGKEIQVLTRNIISSYESIQGLDEHEDPDPVARTEALCSAARDLDRLEVTVRRIIEKKLCDPAKLAARYGGDKGEKWRKRMLKDLFLFVMPDIIRAASAAIFTYGSEGPPGTFDLKEILRYISLVSRLLVIVEDPNNKDHRPVAAHNTALPIRRPYMSIKPLLLGFEIQCKQELQHREDVAEAERQAPILERERRKREEAERLAAEEAQIEHQRRQEEINDAFNQERMKYGLAPVPLAGTQVSQKPQPSEPPQPTEPHQAQELNITAHRIRAEEEVSVLAKEVEALTKKLETAERRATKLRREEQRQLRGYDADDAHEIDYERVEMFPAGNNNAPVTKPWTKTEYEVLADGLRLETGPDKYPNIARRLDRSFDEIFEKALEFKRVIIETLYVPKGIPVPAWIEIIGNEMLPRGRE
ncbi:hypothetical protein VE01_04963 [Pseudogymnoascus verrucosus]|uniref:Uncharacterized protein n=1 Tax=Pseudogymnoascus verrucosus TaxID=342668 RepID=A0A1B8GPN3_9PEZI|nr:uncharacterized protein VE01_04963 [Pseudogymnoascus verrucosus]OBT97770.2 hypothetical protein VE01_04963 [Pseudogymnoascus verrucosus]